MSGGDEYPCSWRKQPPSGRLEVELLGLHVGSRVKAEPCLSGLRDQTGIFVDLR